MREDQLQSELFPSKFCSFFSALIEFSVDFVHFSILNYKYLGMEK